MSTTETQERELTLARLWLDDHGDDRPEDCCVMCEIASALIRLDAEAGRLRETLDALAEIVIVIEREAKRWPYVENGQLHADLASAERIVKAHLSGTPEGATASRLVEELVAAAVNYVRCASPGNGLSPYIQENGRHGKSPWAELIDATNALASQPTPEPARGE